MSPPHRFIARREYLNIHEFDVHTAEVVA